MDEEAIAKALEGKFFRGPSTFYQALPGVRTEDTDTIDVAERDRQIEDENAKFMERRRRELEELEREIDVAPVKWRVPLAMCLDAVCYAHGLTGKELLERSRRRHLVLGRQHAAWLIRKIRPDVSMSQIATRLNYENHTTVFHGIERFEAMKRSYVLEVEKSLAYIQEKTGDESICLL